MYHTSGIQTLIETLARHRARSPHTVGRWASGDGRFYRRLCAGHDLTTRRTDRITQWFSDHWPSDLDWPYDIPRPNPSLGSPALSAMQSDPLVALNDAGHLADPAGFCRRLQIERSVFNEVVRLYRVGGPREHAQPRIGSQARLVYDRLLLAGDRRLLTSQRLARQRFMGSAA